MSNLVSTKSHVVHAISTHRGCPWLSLCGRNFYQSATTALTDLGGVTCGNCLRMIAREHALALKLHQAFLLGVAQAEVPAELLGRPEGLDTMADTLLSDEILWARSELALFADAGHLTAYARRLTSLKLERAFRQAPVDAAALFQGARVLGSTFK